MAGFWQNLVSNGYSAQANKGIDEGSIFADHSKTIHDKKLIKDAGKLLKGYSDVDSNLLWSFVNAVRDTRDIPLLQNVKFHIHDGSPKQLDGIVEIYKKLADPETWENSSTRLRAFSYEDDYLREGHAKSQKFLADLSQVEGLMQDESFAAYVAERSQRNARELVGRAS